MTCSNDDAVEQFCDVITITNDDVVPDLWDMDKLGGELEEKIMDRVRILREKRKKRITFSKPTYKTFEVSGSNGNLLVRQIIAVFSDKEIYKPGMCIVLTVDNKPDAVIVVVKECRPETFTVPKKSEQERAIWDKIFADSMCEVWRENDIAGFDSVNLEAKRKDFTETFSKLWSLPFGEIDPLHRHVFYALVSEMAKPKMPLHLDHDTYKHIPTAACIKIAIETGQTGRLENVFGARKKRVRQQAQNEVGQDVVDNTEFSRKGEWRLNEAKALINMYLGDKDGENFPQDNVTAKVEEIKKFFALEN